MATLDLHIVYCSMFRGIETLGFEFCLKISHWILSHVIPRSGEITTRTLPSSESLQKSGEKTKSLDSINALPSPKPLACKLGHIIDDVWTDKGPPPYMQVDYLSDLRDELECSSSWKFIKRVEGTHPSSTAMRLENASWRAWGKLKNGVKTVAPEDLNWYVSH